MNPKNRYAREFAASRTGARADFAVKKSVAGTLVTLVPKAKGSGWNSYYAEWPSAKDARVTNHGVLVERDDGRVTLTHTSGQVVSEGNEGFGSMSALKLARTGAKAKFGLSDVIQDAIDAITHDERNKEQWVNQATKYITRYRDQLTPDSPEYRQYQRMIRMATRQMLRIDRPMTLARTGAKAQFSQYTLDEVMKVVQDMIARGQVSSAQALLNAWLRENSGKNRSSRTGGKAKFGLERELSLVLNRAGIDHDWDGGKLFIGASDIARAKELIERSGVVETEHMDKVLRKIQKMQRKPASSRSEAKRIYDLTEAAVIARSK